jgi:glycosyltransferase involved in cell wall biosynthesis
VSTVSVVVPVRDGERYLREALESALGQTRPPDQVVVVDDGSSDGSAAIAEALPGVELLRRPAAGPSAARNAGLRAATGELVAFLDADDVADPRRLERQVAVLDGAPQAVGVFGRVVHFLSPDCAQLAGRVRVPAGEQPGWLVGALLARRAAIDAAGPFDETMMGGETVEWLDRLRRGPGTLEMLDHVVLRRRVHDANETQRERAVAHAGYLSVARAAIARSRAEGPA